MVGGMYHHQRCHDLSLAPIEKAIISSAYMSASEVKHEGNKQPKTEFIRIWWPIAFAIPQVVDRSLLSKNQETAK
jgi:hypothetical protein